MANNKLYCAINNLFTIHFHPKLDQTACESRVIRAFKGVLKRELQRNSVTLMACPHWPKRGVPCLKHLEASTFFIIFPVAEC